MTVEGLWKLVTERTAKTLKAHTNVDCVLVVVMAADGTYTVALEGLDDIGAQASPAISSIVRLLHALQDFARINRKQVTPS